MHKTTKNLIFTRAFANARLTSDGTAIPTLTLDGAILMTYVGKVNPTPDTALGDLTESTYTGYAQEAINALAGAAPAWLGPIQFDTNHNGLLVPVTWICTAGPGENVDGYGLLNPAGTALWAIEEFADPVALNGAGKFLQLDFVFPHRLADSIAGV